MKFLNQIITTFVKQSSLKSEQL